MLTKVLIDTLFKGKGDIGYPDLDPNPFANP